LIFEAGGQYIDHVYNRQGSCGGALLVAFRRRTAKDKSFDLTISPARKIKIQKAIKQYQLQMELLSSQLQKYNQNIYGFGASLMMATLAYHLKTDFRELICVLDDDPQKEGIEYQNIPVKVRYNKSGSIPPDSNFIITSLENCRPIFKRITELNPQRILSPLIT
jgi:hypothetical protein